VNFRLRTFAPSDFETLFEIDQACYEPRIAYSRPEIRRYLRFPGSDCVVAESSDSGATAIVGFCITAHRGPWGYIITMDVLASYRRLGVGSHLLAEAERRLIAAGVRTVGLETATDNVAAIAFWQKHGYRSRGVQKNYYPGGRDAFTMTKSLAESAKSSPAHAG
jgi:[ribosomal protein S18]-alanine N-acetyltransferase